MYLYLYPRHQAGCDNRQSACQLLSFCIAPNESQTSPTTSRFSSASPGYGAVSFSPWIRSVPIQASPSDEWYRCIPVNEIDTGTVCSVLNLLHCRFLPSTRKPKTYGWKFDRPTVARRYKYLYVPTGNGTK